MFTVGLFDVLFRLAKGFKGNAGVVESSYLCKHGVL